MVPGSLEFTVVLIGRRYSLFLAFYWPVHVVIHCHDAAHILNVIIPTTLTLPALG